MRNIILLFRSINIFATVVVDKMSIVIRKIKTFILTFIHGGAIFLLESVQRGKRWQKTHQQNKKEWKDNIGKDWDCIIEKIIKTCNMICEKLNKFPISIELGTVVTAYTMIGYWMEESYLKKFNIQFVNGSLKDSLPLWILSILPGIITFLIVCMLWGMRIYWQKKETSKDKKWMFARGISGIIIFILTSAIFYKVVNGFSAKINADNLAISLTHFFFFLFFIWVVVRILTTICLNTEGMQPQNRKILLTVLALFFASVVSLHSLYCRINRKMDEFKTVHVYQSQIPCDNILLSSDGAQIWAVVCENSMYYFAEPVEANNDAQPVNTKYMMTLEKTDAILYAETVGEALQEYKSSRFSCIE